MGGVQIKNCTAVPLKIQLCQVGVLYHDLVKPGEYFIRNTGAVHFTIKATVSDKDDTGWTDTVLPILGVVGTTLAAMVTAGASVGLTALVSGGLVSGTAVVTEAGVVAAGGALLTKEIAIKLFSQAEKDHCYISSAGWYFGGKNHLEIRGGPQILASSKGFEYRGTSLRIVDEKDPSRHS